jgi:hypothetical protein
VDQISHRLGVEAKTRGRDVGQEAGAGGVIRIEKLAVTADRVLLAVEEGLAILGSQKRRLMMVEPPGNARRWRVFEIDDGVFVAGKLTLVKERTSAMDQAMVLVRGGGRDTLPMKAREQRGRASSVETFVVIEDANPQNLNSLKQRKFEQPELLSIKGRAGCVKAGAILQVRARPICGRK